MQYIISNNSLTFYDNEGVPYQVRSDHMNYDRIRTKLLTEKYVEAETLISLADTVQVIQTHLDKAATSPGKYLRPGYVCVDQHGVYYNGELVNSSLTERMIGILQQGKQITPWTSFMEKLYTNPNHTTRFELYDWMSNCSLPLTDDGDFIAYKKVNNDYTDFYSGKFDNRIGMTVSLPDRSSVDPIRTNVCSRGLHFCSGSYLQSYHSGQGRVMVLKINPADVVSIPTDYNFAKGRTWQYKVVGEVEEFTASTRSWPSVVGVRDYSLRVSERAPENANSYAY